MALLNYSCFSLSLRTGSIIIAVLAIIGSTFRPVSDLIRTSSAILTGAAIAFSLLSIVLSIMFLWFGVRKDETWAKKLYAIFFLVAIVLEIFLGILSMVQHRSYWMVDTVISTLLYIYCFLVLYSFYQSGEEE